MVYNIHYDICAMIILVSLIAFYHKSKQIPTFKNKVFGVLLWLTLISLIFDILCGVSLSYAKLMPREFLFLGNMGYFLFRILIIFFFVFYTISLTGKYKNISRKTKILLYVPLIVAVICIAVTPSTEFIFSIDENNAYHREAGIVVTYAIAFYFLAFAGVFATIYRKAITHRTRNAVFLFILLSMIPVGIQMAFPFMLVEALGITLFLLFVYMTVQRPEELLDPDTNLLNEAAWRTMMPGNLALQKNFHVITIIIEDYNSLSNALGIDMIRKLSQSVGKFLSLCAKKKILYRLANHKFCIITDGEDQAEMEELIARIKTRFSMPWDYEEGQIRLFARLCVINCPKEAQTVEELMDYIETAEIQQSTNEVMGAQDLKNKHLKRENDVKRAVKTAIEENRLEVYYQPIYSTGSKKIESAEALVRLYDETLGNIPPDEFIPIAEKTGLISKIGKFVIESVCKFMKEEKLEELGIKFVEVNLSSIECMQDNLIEDLIEILQRYNIRPDQINLEITETAEAYSLSGFRKNLYEIRDRGFTLSLDDYGTGYSTMSYIINLPFKFVKIDKSIVWLAFEDERAMVMIENVIGMMKKLGLQIVAEGIETEEQAKRLLSWDCEYLQGYYYSKPVQKSEFLKLL